MQLVEDSQAARRARARAPIHRPHYLGAIIPTILHRRAAACALHAFSQRRCRCCHLGGNPVHRLHFLAGLHCRLEGQCTWV